MVIDESSRHAMFTRLQEVLGNEHARVLMEHLPPIGWADVATKRDLDHLEARVKAELLAAFRAEMNAQTRTMIFMFVGLAGLAFSAARFI